MRKTKEIIVKSKRDDERQLFILVLVNIKSLLLEFKLGDNMMTPKISFK